MRVKQYGFVPRPRGVSALPCVSSADVLSLTSFPARSDPTCHAVMQWEQEEIPDSPHGCT
jgi:hypothetical protein